MNGSRHLRFSKMHGAGNDFVILDRRGASVPLSPRLAARIADRRLGVGCDQLITIEAARNSDSVAAYGVLNSDGSRAQQCGNGARCAALWLQREGTAADAEFQLDSPAGTVQVRRGADQSFAVQMGVADFSPAAIGMRDSTRMSDPYALDFARDRIYFGAVSMGNPHALLEVADIASADVAQVGPMLQAHPLFTDRCNVGFAQVQSRERIQLRVFERGAGETLACGSGACAAVAILARRGRVASRVAVALPGGVLQIEWHGAEHPVWMSGPAEFVFEGEFIA
jgi:diaminopimelate epimerase